MSTRRRSFTGTQQGRRDRALLLLALQTGLRVSELINLSCGDLVFAQSAHVRCSGKGRKDRATPIRKDSIKVLRGWLIERGGNDAEPLFVSNRKKPLSRDAVEQIVHKHVTTAAKTCPSLKKKRVTPHVLRHYLPYRIISGSFKEPAEFIGNIGST
jgi:integrase/recombinase XerD